MAKNNLEEYRAKRNFAVTHEPKGKTVSSGGALRFCVQHHAARTDHYDLRLEFGGTALSWALPKGPSFNPRDKRLAVRVENHPVDYMEFEGVIPQGEYGGGTVMLWDEGEWIPRTDPEKGLETGSLKFRLEGVRLKGEWALVRMEKGEGKDPWLLIKERDGFAKSTAGIARFTRSVLSKKSFREIEAQSAVNPFARADVMLAKLCNALPADTGWVYELKYDGHRTVGFVEGGKANLRTRNGLDCTKTYPAAAEALAETFGNRAAVVDGEMVVTGSDGVPDFSALQAYAKGRRADGLVYVLFDLLALDGRDLRGLSLLERKEKLKSALHGAPPVLSYSEHAFRMGKEELRAIERRGMEGILLKRANSPYSAGKNGDWLKLKFRNRQEFAIGGYLPREGGGIKSLLVGVTQGNALRFAGCVGTGFDEKTRLELAQTLSAQARRSSPFESVPKKYAEAAVWVKPALAAEVEFAELTPLGLLRQASFKGLRADKAPNEIVFEHAETKNEAPMSAPRPEKFNYYGVEISHPEKVMFPDRGFSKGDLAAYYAAVAPRMLPYVKDRPLSLVCCPAGIEGERFFRRRLEGTFSGVKIFSAESESAFTVSREKGILALAQYNAVEFHVGGNRIHARPDLLVFDLDPDEALPLASVKRGAQDLRDLLSELGLRGFLKTSGGKGYHVAVPLRTGVDPQTFRAFSRQVAELLVAAFPKRYTASISKKARTGKIFIDWQRNGLGATSAAPYTLRARAGAPVAAPIDWEELSRVSPDGIDLPRALHRLHDPDPWEEFFAVKKTQSLKSETGRSKTRSARTR